MVRMARAGRYPKMLLSGTNSNHHRKRNVKSLRKEPEKQHEAEVEREEEDEDEEEANEETRYCSNKLSNVVNECFPDIRVVGTAQEIVLSGFLVDSISRLQQRVG